MKKLNLSALVNNNLISDENIVKIDENQVVEQFSNDKIVKKTQEPLIQNLSQSKKLTLKDLNINIDSSKKVDLNLSENAKKVEDVIVENEEKLQNVQLNSDLIVQPKLKFSLANKENDNFEVKTEVKNEKIDKIKENNNDIEILTIKQELKIQDSETNLNLQIENNNEIFSNYIPSTKKQEDDIKKSEIVNNKKSQEIILEKISLEKPKVKELKDLKEKKNSINLKSLFLKYKPNFNKYFKYNLKLKLTNIFQNIKNKKIYIPITLSFLLVFWFGGFLLNKNFIDSSNIKWNIQEIENTKTGIINENENKNKVNINNFNTIDNNIKSHKIQNELKEFLLKNQK